MAMDNHGINVTSCKELPSAAERHLLMLPSIEGKRALNGMFVIVARHVIISACKHNAKLFRLLGSSSLHINSR